MKQYKYRAVAKFQLYTMKKFLLSALALVLAVTASAQKKSKDAAPVVDEWNDVEIFEQHKLYPRANVVSYADENAIEKGRYEESPYYISLNGQWLCKLSSSVGSRPTDIEQKTFSTEGWAAVDVPSGRLPNNAKSKKLTKPSDVADAGNHVVSYYREFNVPKQWKEYRCYLNLQARSAYYVWVNHEYVGYSEDSRDISEFDLTEHLKIGKTNNIIVQVVALSDGAMLEANYARTIGGITSDVFLTLKPYVNIMDYKLVADYSPSNRVGTLEATLDIFNHYKKGQYYVEIEVWDPKGHEVDKVGRWVVFDKKNELSHKFERTLPAVSPWTAETPDRYTFVARLRDQKMNLVETVGCRFGFRTVQMKDGNLVVNGQPVTIRGTIYAPYDKGLHSFPSKEMLRNELQQMKRHNINAVRTTLYSPASPYFYELCDEYGLYVFCDANLQPFSTQAKAVATDREYINLFVSRMQNMYERLKNHPSIICWSLGNGVDNGVCMENAFRTIKQKDKTRPVMYSGAGYSDNTDFIAPVDILYDDLKLFGSKQVQPRPLIMASFGNTTGNTYGSLEPLWQLVRRYGPLQGGFAAWWNTADFFDPATQSDRTVTGLMDNGTAKPFLAELRNIYRPFDIQLVNISPDAAEFNVTNFLSFLSLNDYILDYNISSNLKTRIIEGEVSVDLRPGESKNFKLKIPALTLYAGEELFIHFTIRQRTTTTAVPRGTELGVFEFPLPMREVKKEKLTDYDREALYLEHEGDPATGIAKVFNDNIELRYDLARADIVSFRFRDRDLTVASPVVNFWRPPTDNDRVDKNALRLWQNFGPQNLRRTVVATHCRQVDANTVCIDAMLRFTDQDGNAFFDVKQSIAVLHTGDVLIDNEVVASEQVKTLPKVGLQMCLPKTLDSVRWFGLDKESYPDRRQAGVAGTWRRASSDFFFPYLKPQESGNRTDVRWVSVEGDGMGLFVDFLDTTFNFSLYPYSDVDLFTTQEAGELRQRDFLTFNVDYRQAAVGSALAGHEVPDQFLLADKKYHFVVHLRAYDLAEFNPYDFCRVEYPHIASSVLPMPTIAKDRDRFDQPMTITLSSSIPKAEIRYTTDGSTPDRNSPLYKKPFRIDHSTYVKAKTFMNDATPSFTAVQRFNFDYITGATYVNKANTPYNFNPESILFDGETGEISELSRGWLGFSGTDLNVVLELSKGIDLQQVTASFAHVPDAWAFAPNAVQVFVSSDGENYSPAINAKLKYAPEEQAMNTPQRVTVTIDVNQSDIRFVRFVAKNMGRIPAWHKARGLRPWIMVDEIQLLETINIKK